MDTGKKETIRLHIADMPKDVHLAAKMTALKLGMSLKGFVIEALVEKVNRTHI